MADDSFSAQDLGLDELIKKFDELKNKVKEGSVNINDAVKEMSSTNEKYKASVTDVNQKINQLTQQIVNYKSRQDELKESIKKGTISEFEYNKEMAEVSHAMNRAIYDRKNYINVIQSEEGSVKRAKAENALWRRERNEMGEATTKNKTAIEEYNKKIDANTKIIGENVDKQSRHFMGMGEVNGALGKLIPGFSGVSTAAKSFGIVLNLSLLPITAVIAAIAALIAYFKRSEEGQNSLAKVTKVFQVVLGNLMDIVSKVGEALFNAIKKPKEAWEGFKDFLDNFVSFFKDTFGNILGGYIDIWVGGFQTGFAAIGVAWQKFKGIFVDNSEKIKKAQDKLDEANQKIKDGVDRVKEGAINLKDAAVGAYNKIKDAVTGLINETQREIDIAKRLADMQAALDKQIRNEKVEHAKNEAKIADLRAKVAKKDKYDGEQRLKMLDEVAELEKKNMDAAINIAKQKAYIHAEEKKSTKEAKLEQANLEAEIFRIQMANSEKLRSLEMQRATAVNDMLEDQRKVAQASVDQMQYEVESWQIANRDKLDITGEYVKKQSEILKAGLDTKISEIDAKENESEAAKNAEKLKLNNDYNLALQQMDAEFTDSEKARKLEIAQIEHENELAAAQGNIFAVLDLERQGLDMKMQQEIEAAERIGMSTENIEKKYSDAKIELNRAEADAKLALAGGFASNLATIFGEQTAIGKAAAVAATTISTYQGATQAFTSFSGMGPVGVVLGIAAAAAAVAAGIANVKKILAVKSGLPGDSAGGSVPSAGSQPTPIKASVNPQIGQGIVSRQTAQTGLKTTDLTVQPTLVIDQVTSNQNQKSSQAETVIL